MNMSNIQNQNRNDFPGFPAINADGPDEDLNDVKLRKPHLQRSSAQDIPSDSLDGPMSKKKRYGLLRSQAEGIPSGSLDEPNCVVPKCEDASPSVNLDGHNHNDKIASTSSAQFGVLVSETQYKGTGNVGEPFTWGNYKPVCRANRLFVNSGLDEGLEALPFVNSDIQFNLSEVNPQFDTELSGAKAISLWDVDRSNFEHFSSTLYKTLTTQLIGKSLELTIEEKRYVDAVTDTLRCVTTFEEANEQDKSKFLNAEVDANYTPIVFGGKGSYCRIVSWRSSYHALVNLTGDDMVIITQTAGTIFKIVSNTMKPTETQMLNAVGDYTGISSMYEKVATITEGISDAKSQMHDVGNAARQISAAMPEIAATVASVGEATERVAQTVPILEGKVEDVSRTFRVWEGMTHELRENVSSIVPTVISSVKDFLGSVYKVGAYTLATLVVISVFKILVTLFEKLSKKKRIVVLRIVGLALVTAGIGTFAYKVAGDQMLKFADMVKEGVDVSYGNWDKARDDCLPEYTYLKRIRTICGKQVLLNSSIKVKKSEPMFRFKRVGHFVRRSLWDLYTASGITDRARIAFNALFYVDSPGISQDRYEELMEMVANGATAGEVLRQFDQHDGEYKLIGFADRAEAKAALDSLSADEKQLIDHANEICQSSRSVSDKLMDLSSSVAINLWKRFEENVNAGAAESKHELAPTELHGPNRDGPNSLLALMLVIVRMIQNPDLSFKREFENLRKESNNMKVLTSASECIWDVLPNKIRLVAYEKFGMGGPTDLPRSVVELLVSCHALLGDIADLRKRTSQFKRIYQGKFAELQKELMKEEYYTKQNTFAYSVLTGAFTKMRDSIKLLDEVPDDDGMRVQTLCLWFEGISGLGKSGMMEALSKRFAPDWPTERRVHTWNVVEPFMSGYNHQWAVDADDVGSNPTALATNSFFQDLLTKASRKRVCVNKAFEKGQSFTSHVLAISSNASMLEVLESQRNAGVLTNPEAIIRRFNGRNGMHVTVLPAKRKFVKTEEGREVADVQAIVDQSEHEKDNYAHAVFCIGGKHYSYDGFCARFGLLYKNALKEFAENTSKANNQIDTRYARFARAVQKQYEVDTFPIVVPDELQSSMKDDTYAGVFKKTKGRFGLPTSTGSTRRSPKSSEYKKPTNRKFQRSNRRVANLLDKAQTHPGLRRVIEQAEKDGHEFSFKTEENDKEVLDEFEREEKESLASILEEETRRATQENEGANLLDNQSFTGAWANYVDKTWQAISSTIDTQTALKSNINWTVVATVLGGVLTLSGAICAAYKAIKWFRESDEDRGGDYVLMRGPAVYSSDGSFKYRASSKRNHGHRFNRGRARDKRNPTFQMQGHEPEAKLPDCARLLQKCTAKFCNKPVFDPNNFGWAVFVRDKHMLLNRHYVTGEHGIVYNNLYTFMLQGVVFSSVMREDDVQILLDPITGTKTDLIIWRVQAKNGMSCLSTPTLLKHFQTEEEVQRDYYTTGKRPLELACIASDTLDMKPVPQAQATTSRDWKLQYKSGEMVTADRALVYPGQFIRGDCGKLLIKGKIIGVHIAGRPGVVGTAQLVTTTMLQTAMEFHTCMDVPLIDESSHEELPPGSYHGENSNMCGMPMSGAFVPFASVPKPAIMCHKTDLEPTLLHEYGSHWAAKCKKEPAVLGVDDPRYNGTASRNDQFLADAMERYAKRPPDLPEGLVRAAVAKLVHAVPPGNAPLRVWTVDEALNPAKIGSVMMPFKRSTGAGWGFNGVGKHEQIGFDEATQTYFAKPCLTKKMQHLHNLLDQGKNPLVVFTEFPKDEVLPRSKIERKWCRTVSASPLDFTLFTRQVFGAFVDSWQGVPMEWGHAVSLDVLGPHWDTILKRMHRVGDYGFDSDFKKFDSTMSKQFMVTFWQQVDKWYKKNAQWDEHSSFMRWVVIYNMVHSKHIIGRTIVMKMMGLPSGSQLTTIMNCFWARTLLLVGYALLAQDSDYDETISYTFKGYDKHVKCFVLGDDNISAVSNEVGEWYNAKSLGDALLKYGITITPAIKDTELSANNVPLEKLEFLACTTRIGYEVPGWRFYPVINEGSLSKALRYVRTKESYPMPVALDSNIYDSLLRLFGSGRERYEEFYVDVVGAYTRMYPHAEVQFPTYDELLLEYRVDDEFVRFPELEQHESPEEGGFIFMSTMDVPTANNMCTGYDNPVSMESNAKLEGVQPIVGMPIVETPQTLRILTRRNYAVCAETAGHVQDFLSVNIGAVFGRHGGTGNQRLNPLQKIGAWFRVWSGPVHAVAYSEQSLSMSFLPELNVSPQSTTGIFDTTIPGNATTYGGAYNFAPRSVGYVSAKLPFTSAYNCLKIPHFSSDDPDETNTGVLVVRTDDKSEKIAVTMATGDDFNMGIPYMCPRIKVANVNLEPDTYPANAVHGQPNGGFEFQGITVSKNSYNVEAVQSSGVEMNPENNMETTSDTAIHARAGNDAPNVPTQLVSVLRQSAIYGSSAQQVKFDPSFAITNEMQPADMVTANTHDTMPLSEVIRPMLISSALWTTSQLPGTVLASGFISPSDAIKGLQLGADIQSSALATVSTMYGYWRGAYKKGISVVTSGVHVGRLGFACIYGQTNIPTTLSELTSQRYVVFEVNSDNNVMVVEIPYVSTTRVKETFHGQSDPSTYSTGVWALFVMNSLRAPSAASTTVEVIISEGAADSLQFIAPFSSNRTLSLGHVYGPGMEKGVNTECCDGKSRWEFQSSMGTPVPDAEESVGVTMADVTAHGGTAYDNVPDTDDVKIVKQPFLSYVDMLKRIQFMDSFDWTTTPTSGPLYSAAIPFDVMFNTAERAVASFRQFKMTTVITAKVTASTFHSGRLILMSLPMTTEAQMNAMMTNRAAYTYPNHVFLDAGASNSVQFRIPFQYIKPYLEDKENYAQFQIRQLSSLRVGAGGSTSASVSLYVHFEDTELRVIRPL